MRRLSRSVLGLLVLLAGCGGEPLVCPPGSTPIGARCVPDDEDGGSDPGSLDGGSVVDDGSVDAGALEDAPSDAGCVPAVEEDLPDLMGIDSNCDGIDGDSSRAVFVRADGAADAPGTREDPVGSIGRAIELASARGFSQVLVATGEYAEALTLTEGVSIYGGYDGASWSRSDARAIVRAASPVLLATDVDAPTRVSTLELHAADATTPGASSIAAVLVGSDGVVLERVSLRAGQGAAGLSPTRPDPRSQGAPGLAGSNGVRSGACSGSVGSEPFGGEAGTRALGCSACSRGGVGGGPGGYQRSGSGLTTAQNGARGFRAGDVCTGSVVGTGVLGGVAGAGGADGRRGEDGAAGSPGASGSGGAAMGAFTQTGYVPASGTAGMEGRAGDGGGGGGGGLGCFITDFCNGSGGGGGGGGAGGCGGLPGGGGGGGGASIALYLWESVPTLIRVDLRSGDGGDGGAGARGGEGGLGGEPGPGGTRFVTGCNSGVTTNGGAGGRGGGGGEGGGGGGGTGGPSIGILLGAGSSQAAESVGVSITTGNGGARGVGGGSAPAGENGFVQPMFEVGG